MNYSRTMLYSYLNTALWSSTHDETGEPLDVDFHTEVVSFSTKLQAARDLRDFCLKAGDLLDGLSPTEVAKDFWQDAESSTTIRFPSFVVGSGSQNIGNAGSHGGHG